ncbi:guanine nucleotide binding protein, alpha subunit [Sistotremastrum suecicum HHB10207 ss-3]|nr:guanine nucleotide binding protein, alpha subunit [Sistotremastrum suecicum HHB10207 ss-3]
MSPRPPTVSRRRSISDPLAFALLPPPNETPAEREQRLRREAEAKKVNDDIDDMLKAERAAQKKRKEVKILLLGQSESGKSTTLKQFQIIHAHSQFQAERSAWRAVIYLNLVRSVRRILDAITLDESDEESPYGGPRSPTALLPATRQRLPELATLKLRLSPIIAIEEQLIQQLACSEENDTRIMLPPRQGSPEFGQRGSGEISVRTGVNWKQAFAKFKGKRPTGEGNILPRNDPNDPIHVLHACADDMNTLWNSPLIKDILQQRRIRLEESSGFYLNEITRITDLNYVPSDDDVLKARLKTVGVVEHSFSLDKGTEKGVDWKIYDVGGARNQRQAWAPYFEDVNAIIFLAPISAFDQVLSEDPNVNRLEDSLLLWRNIVSNKLLQKVHLVLFLNKCDLLQMKLDNGVMLNQHMTSYGDRPNDYDSVSRYFRNKFAALHQSFSPNQDREAYIHLTCVTDTRKTSEVITNVRDIILKENLKDSRLI